MEVEIESISLSSRICFLFFYLPLSKSQFRLIRHLQLIETTQPSIEILKPLLSLVSLTFLLLNKIGKQGKRELQCQTTNETTRIILGSAVCSEWGSVYAVSFEDDLRYKISFFSFERRMTWHWWPPPLSLSLCWDLEGLIRKSGWTTSRLD